MAREGRYKLKVSKIHGQGMFAVDHFDQGEDIDVGIEFWFGIFPVVTGHFGQWLNHSYQPNIHLVYHDNAWYLQATKKIKPGEELVMNYDDTPWYIKKPRADFV